MNKIAKHIESYIPEMEHLNIKEALPARLCREDCAVLDASSPDRVLAYRGRTEIGGESFSSAFGISRADMRFLTEQLGHCDAIVVGGARTPILILCGLIDAAGVLLALSPHVERDAFLRALEEVGAEVAPAPSLQHVNVSAHRSDADTAELISEWSFYFSRIFSADPSIGLCTRGMLIANFTGCPAMLGELAIPTPALPPRALQCTSAFLLCTLLTLRHCDGEVSARTDGDGADAPTLCVSLQADAEQSRSNLSELSGARFLSHHGFRHLRVFRTPDGICLETELPSHRSAELLHSEVCLPSTPKFVLLFQKITQNHLNL